MTAGPDLVAYALRLGDDALVLAQRLGEWSATAPELEEDVALTNIGLDLLGQARSLLSYAGEVEGAGRDEDDLAYLREEREFPNCQLVEQPNDDFAATIARQLYFSTYQLELYRALRGSADPTLAAVAAKAVKEVAYHRDHATMWTLRLGDGTEESHERMQRRPGAAVAVRRRAVRDRRGRRAAGRRRGRRRPGHPARRLGPAPGRDPGRGHPGPPRRRLAARQRPPGRPQRAPGLPAGRAAVPAPPPPGGPLVTGTGVATEAARELAGRVADPEIPVLTIEDLGILREVAVDDQAGSRSPSPRPTPAARPWT